MPLTTKKKQPHTSSKKTTTTASSTNSPTGRNKKKRNCARVVPKRLSVKPKKLWVVQPTSTILLKYIKETFTLKSKSLNFEKNPINDFINHYDKKLKRVDRG